MVAQSLGGTIAASRTYLAIIYRRLPGIIIISPNRTQVAAGHSSFVVVLAHGTLTAPLCVRFARARAVGADGTWRALRCPFDVSVGFRPAFRAAACAGVPVERSCGTLQTHLLEVACIIHSRRAVFAGNFGSLGCAVAVIPGRAGQTFA